MTLGTQASESKTGPRIIAIAQVYNEVRKGNLDRFFSHLQPLVDEIVIYDDGSSDGSYEYALSRTPHVIRGQRNDFAGELDHKQQLLERALTLEPDFILWLDADEVLATEDREALTRACAWMDERNLDGASLKELNLWRSASWRRTDSAFDDGWFVRLWRVSPDIRFEQARGLHRQQHPASITHIDRYRDLGVLHYGFADERNLALKYLTYRAHGQRGYDSLDRLISEESLTLERVPDDLIPADLRVDEDPPTPLPFLESMAYVERWREEVRRPSVSIVCLIYKSVEWARFVYEQVLRYTDMDDKEFFFVANDATDEVLAYLESEYVPHYVWTNSEQQRSEWYINNVYRAWNFGAEQAKGDFILFVNSDMAFSPGWFESLWDAYDGASAVASRLVESGKLRSGLYGIEKDFGSTPGLYREAAFQAFADDVREGSVLDGGLFMPLLLRRDAFLQVGGYPEGNIKLDSDIFHPVIAKLGERCVSGDVVLVDRLATLGILHRTACDSVIYHFQMGEMDSQPSGLDGAPKLVAVCNDLVTGTMGERVLWDFLLADLPSSIGVDQRVVTEKPFETAARRYISETTPGVEVIVQNATFIDPIDTERYTIAFLQDNLRAMKRDSRQQEANLGAARTRVTNSLATARSYPEYEFEIVPVGVDDSLFRPLDKAASRAEYDLGPGTIGIFVGAFDAVKGWAAVRECIEAFPEITWLLVTKKLEDFDAPNVRCFSRIPQSQLVTLLNCADFFILGSPVETQCLAAIEACLCDVPVVMRLTGVFADLTDAERSQAGIFTDDLVEGVRAIQGATCDPRALVVAKGWTTSVTTARWRHLVELALQEVRAERVGYVGPVEVSADGGQIRRARVARVAGYAPVPRQYRGRRLRYVSPVFFAMKLRELGPRGFVRSAASKIVWTIRGLLGRD